MGSVRITPALYQNVQHDAKLIHSTPKPMLVAVDGDDYLVKMLFVTKGQPFCPNASGCLLTKLQRPVPHRFISRINTANSQHSFDHSKAQQKAKIQPDCVADELQRETVTST